MNGCLRYVTHFVSPNVRQPARPYACVFARYFYHLDKFTFKNKLRGELTQELVNFQVS